MILKMEGCSKAKKGFEIKVSYIDGDAYYPDGKGGQLGDRGYIGDAEVLGVKKDSIIRLHIIQRINCRTTNKTSA